MGLQVTLGSGSRKGPDIMAAPGQDLLMKILHCFFPDTTNNVILQISFGHD